MFSRIVNFVNNFLYVVTYFKSFQKTVNDFYHALDNAVDKINKLEKRIEVLNDRLDILENFYYSLDEVL